MDSSDIDLIKHLFGRYQQLKKEKRLYSSDDFIPQNLIMFYYGCTEKLDFNNLVYNFKRKYIYNENEMEGVHSKSERDGLSAVYDYIKNAENDNCPNIYIILKLHSLLYSKVPYPEFGGKFRTSVALISDSDIQSTNPEYISLEISKLYNEYLEILQMSEMVKKNNNSILLMSYIDRCIDLKCRLIEIHPFPDGNGRTCRAMLNLLFRKVNLPPVYVRNKEKAEYIEAMDRAIRLKDTKTIRKFYYYKICDSIIELDINERNKQRTLVVDKPKTLVKKK